MLRGDVRHCGVCSVSVSLFLSLPCFACCVAAPGNEIGAAGAGALAEGLKEMTNLENLYLGGSFHMDDFVCEMAVMSWIKQVAGVHTGKGQGAIKRNNDVGVVTEG